MKKFLGLVFLISLFSLDSFARATSHASSGAAKNATSKEDSTLPSAAKGTVANEIKSIAVVKGSENTKEKVETAVSKGQATISSFGGR